MAGLDLLDDTEEEFLTRYVLSYCKGAKTSVDIDHLLSFSVPSLADRLDDFVYCVQKVGKMRRNVMVTRFHSSFKCDGLDKMSSTIEWDARDTLRYLAGVLNWLSEELSKEYDIVYKLLWPNHLMYAGALQVQHLGVISADFKVAEHVRTLVLNRTFGVFCLPLSKLVDQVLQYQLDLTSSYELCAMLESFFFCVPSPFSEEFSVCVTFKELLPKVRSVLYSLLDRYCEEKFSPSVLADLSPSPVMVGVPQLLEIIKVHDDGADRQTPSIDSVILTLLNPILEICEQALMELKLDEAFGISSTDPGQSYALSGHALSPNVGSAPSPQTDGASTIFLRNLVDAFILPLKEQRGSYSMDFAWNLGTILCSRLSSLTAAEAKAIMDRCGHHLLPHTSKHERKGDPDDLWRMQFGPSIGIRPYLGF